MHNKSQTIIELESSGRIIAISMAFWPLEFFSDTIYRLLNPDGIKDCSVAEIGSGGGRIVYMPFRAIYDQLSPFIAKCCTRSETEKLPVDGKFENVQFDNFYGYSWTRIGIKK